MKTVTNGFFADRTNERAELPNGMPLIHGVAAVNFGTVSFGRTVTRRFTNRNTGTGTPLSQAPNPPAFLPNSDMVPLF